jgi:GH24 family phage-related lysozyme (muramidase)
MSNEEPELVAVLHDVASTQRKLADVLAAKSSGKDFWDKFGAVSTFLSSVVIAAVAAWFTHQYDKQQLNVNQLTILEKFIPHLASGKPEVQKVAILEITALSDAHFAVELAKLYPNAGTIAGVQEIANNGNTDQQSIARTALGSFDVPPQAMSILKKFEGFSDHAYDDGTGVWAIGYGTIRYQNGKPVQRGDTITESDASQNLAYELHGYAASLAAIPHWNEMNTNQQSALISFAHNMGVGFYGTADFHTLSAALRDRRWTEVPAALLIYSYPNSPIHAAMLRRRTAEANLWQGKGEFASSTIAGSAKGPSAASARP